MSLFISEATTEHASDKVVGFTSTDRNVSKMDK